MYMKIRKLLAGILTISLCILSLNNANLYNSVFAEDSYGIIAGKNSGVFYGEQLKDSGFEYAYDIYELIKTVNTETTELIFVFPESIKLEGKDQAEISTLNTDLFERVYNTVQIAMDAFIKDYPEVFWFDYGKCTFTQVFSYSYDDDGNIQWFIKKLKISFNKDEAFELEAMELCEIVYAKAYEIIDSVDSKSLYGRLKEYHDYLCSNITYILDSTYPRNIYGGLIDGQGVCESYAESFKFLCDLSGLTCISVMGKAGIPEPDEYHLWNYVMMDDGNWYAVDVTWDDQPNLNPSIIYDHFLCGSSNVGSVSKVSFESSHATIGDFSLTEIYSFTYPDISSDKYVYDPRRTPTPSPTPTQTPTVEPTVIPTAKPTATPTVEPTATPTVEPTTTPTLAPTETPTPEPTATPTLVPTETPTPEPTATFTVVPSFTPTIEATEKAIIKYVLGDVNDDGKISARDALLVLKHVAKISELDSEQQLKAADVGGEGNIDSLDALEIIKYVAGLIEKLN